MAETNDKAKAEADLFFKAQDYLRSGGNPKQEDTSTPPSSWTKYEQPLKQGLGVNEYYRADNGTYTKDTNDTSLSKISINSETGDIDITAPQSFLDSDTYKNDLKPVLETLSQNYKLNPEYKYALLNDDTTTKNTQGWLEDINKDLPQYVEQRISLDKSKAEISQNDGVNLNDEQVIKMSSVASEIKDESGNVIQKVNDDTVQMIPERIKNMAAFNSLNGWDKDSHGVTWKNLKEVWDREKVSDDDIHDVYDAVEDYFEAGDFSNPDEYAEMYAFRQFINTTHPEAGFWRGVGDGVGNFIYGILSGIGGGLAKMVSVINDVVGNVTGLEEFKDAADTYNALYDKQQQEIKEIGEDLAEVNASAATTLAVSGSLGEIVPVIVASEVLEALVKKNVAGAIGAAAQGVEKVASAATKAASALEATESVKGIQTAVTLRKIAEVAEVPTELNRIVTTINGLRKAGNTLTEAGKLYQAGLSVRLATEASMVLLNSKKLSSIVAGSIGAMRTAAVLSKVPSVAGFMSEVVVDVACTNPKIFRRLLAGDMSDENKGYLIEQAVWNIAPWAAFAGLRRVGGVVKETAGGQVANAIIRKQTSKWAATMGQIIDDAKVKLLHHGDENFNLTKFKKLQEKGNIKIANAKFFKETRARHNYNRQVAALKRYRNLTQRRVYRGAERQIGKLALFNGEDVGASIAESARIFNRKADNLLTDAWLVEASTLYGQDVGYMASQIVAQNPALKVAREAYISQLTEVIKLEKKAGIKGSSRVVDFGFGEARAVSKVSNEYAYGLYRIELAKATMKNYNRLGLSTKGVEQELEYYTKATQKFEKENPELAVALQELLNKGKKLSYYTQDAAVAAGVMNRAELSAMRNSGYFNEGYVRSQRMSEWEKYQSDNPDLKVAELRGKEHMKWGFDGDAPEEFQDMTLVLFNDLSQVAKKATRKQTTEALQRLGEKVEVVVSGAEREMVENLSQAKGKTFHTLMNTADNAVNDIATDDLFDTVFGRKTGKFKALTQSKKVDRLAKKIESLKTKDIRLNNRQVNKIVRSVYMSGMGDELSAVVIEKIGKSVADLSVQEWEQFLQVAPNKVKATLKAIIEEYPEERLWGNITRADLPMISKKEYFTITGITNLREAPAYIRPFLSDKTGLSIQDVIPNIPIDETSIFAKEAFSGEDRASRAIDTINGIYSFVNRNKNSAKLDLSGETLSRLIKNSDASTQSRIYAAMIESNMDDILDFDGGKIRNIAKEVRRSELETEAITTHMTEFEALAKIQKETGIENVNIKAKEDDNILSAIDEFIDDIIEANSASPKLISGLEAFQTGDDLVEYVTLRSLVSDGKMKELSEKMYKRSYDEYKTALIAKYTVEKDGKKVLTMPEKRIESLAKQFANETTTVFKDRVYKRYGNIANELIDNGNDVVITDLVSGDLYAKVSELNSEIAQYAITPDIVKTYDNLGREEYVRLSPAVADMITTMPGELRRSWFGELQNMLVQTFRMGTTGGLVVPSLLRQGVRDPLQAMALGGVTKTSGMVERELSEQMLDSVLGETVAEYYKQYMPDLYGQIVRESKETGESVTNLIAKQERSLSQAGVENQLQSQMYEFNRKAKIARGADGTYNQGVFDNMMDRFEKFYSKTETLNNIRESHVRMAVYNDSFQKALNRGHSVQEARNIARMMQAEVSTNFARQSYHLANLTRTVPYLSSAINGAKSFWRMYSLDPVGVTTRIIGGFIVPATALLVISLGDEENLRVYKQIPEYEKNDNIVFVLNGQKLSVPVPQEIASLIAPIRSMVETMHDANDHSFEELMANNLLGFVPYDLQNFVNLDSDRLLVEDFNEDPMGHIMNSHIIPGISGLASQMLPPLAKSGVMMATGYDPYTRKPINTAYNLVDPETGENIVMDYKSGKLAEGLGNILGQFGVSAQMAQAVLNNLLGSGNMDIIDGLTELVASVPEGNFGGGLTSVAERFGNRAAGVFTIADYGEQSNLAWNRAMSTMYRRKEELLADKEYKSDIAALNNTSYDWGSEDAKNKALQRVKSKQQAFQEDVLKMSKNIVKNYDGGTLDHTKLAAIISLLTFDPEESNNNANAAERANTSDASSQARSRAIETMQALGFDSTSDYSIFGYYKENQDGTITKEYYSPMAILNFKRNSYQQRDIKQNSYQQRDINAANIEEEVKDNDLFTKHETIKNEIDAAFNSNGGKNYDAADAVRIMWNGEVAKAIAPWVTQMTPEAAINNTAVLNYLYPLIEVPSSFETNDKGRIVSLGEKGNKKRAYYESWIKSMYHINDKYKGQY